MIELPQNSKGFALPPMEKHFWCALWLSHGRNSRNALRTSATSAGNLRSLNGSTDTMSFTNTPGAWTLSSEQSLSFEFGLCELCSDTLGWQCLAGHLKNLCNQCWSSQEALQSAFSSSSTSPTAADCQEGC